MMTSPALVSTGNMASKMSLHATAKATTIINDNENVSRAFSPQSVHVCRLTGQLKPRPHQQQCRSNIVECYQSNNSVDKVKLCFDIVAVFGKNVAGFGNSVAVFGNNVKVERCFHIVAGVDEALDQRRERYSRVPVRDE